MFTKGGRGALRGLSGHGLLKGSFIFLQPSLSKHRLRWLDSICINIFFKEIIFVFVYLHYMYLYYMYLYLYIYITCISLFVFVHVFYQYFYLDRLVNIQCQSLPTLRLRRQIPDSRLCARFIPHFLLQSNSYARQNPTHIQRQKPNSDSKA